MRQFPADGILTAMLSVIIPTLNEAVALPDTLEHARRMMRLCDTEVVVSDCHSTDGTVSVAAQAGARIVTGGTSRATALNRGARAARGDVLLFLHADSKLPAGFDRAVTDALERPGVVGGAFDFNWASHPASRGLNREMLRIIRIVNRIRFRWTGNFYGDQGIFTTRQTFDLLGGFPEICLLEDLRFSRKLRARGRTAIVSPAIKTSPRRFLTRGVARQFVMDLRVLALDSFGFFRESVGSRYNSLNQSAAYLGTKPSHGHHHRPTAAALSGHRFETLPLNYSDELVG